MVIMYDGAVTTYVVSTDLNVPRHFCYLDYLPITTQHAS